MPILTISLQLLIHNSSFKTTGTGGSLHSPSQVKGRGKTLMPGSLPYPLAGIVDAITQTVDAVRLVIASILQLRGIVASQQCELDQLRSEINRLRGGMPLPLISPPFTGFGMIGVSTGGLSLPGYPPQYIPAATPPILAPPAIVIPDTSATLFAPSDLGDPMTISTTSALKPAYSFFSTPTTAPAQANPTMTLHKPYTPNAFFPNAGLSLFSTLSNHTHTPSYFVPNTPTTSFAVSSYTPPTGPFKPPPSRSQKFSPSPSASHPYRQR